MRHGLAPGEWRPDATGVPAVHPDQIPPGTRIQREGRARANASGTFPPAGNSASSCSSACVWTTITAAVSGAFLFGTPADGQQAQPWFLYPFFAVFWAIGLGCSMPRCATNTPPPDHVTRDLVTLRREMFGRVKEKSLVTSQVNSVAQAEFYQQNYQPVYGVEIRGRDGKLRFGTTLREVEKAWLVADIKRAVFGEPAARSRHARRKRSSRRAVVVSFPLPPLRRDNGSLVRFSFSSVWEPSPWGFPTGRIFPPGKDDVDWIAVVFKCHLQSFQSHPDHRRAGLRWSRRGHGGTHGPGANGNPAGGR